MKKKLWKRGLFGFPAGMAIGEAITIVTSLRWGAGEYYPCVPQLAEAMGSEINAVALQAFMCGIVGMAFAMASVIWEMERWSIAKQTGIFFAVTAAVMMPVAYLMGWMGHGMKSAAVYFGIFTIIYIVLWMIQYVVFKYKLKKMNEKLHEG